VLEGRRRVLGEEHLSTFEAMNNLAGVYMRQGKFAQAEQLLAKGLESRRRVPGEDHPDSLLSPMNNLAFMYAAQGKLAQAEQLWVEAIQVSRRVKGEGHPDTLLYMNSLGRFYVGAGRVPEATNLLEQAWAKARKQLDLSVEPSLEERSPASVFLNISDTLGSIYERGGQFGKAESLYRETLEMVRQRHKEASSLSAALQAYLAYTLLKQQRYAEAESLLRDCLKFREQNAPDLWQTFSTKSALGGSLLGQKKFAEAEPLLLAGYEGLKQREGQMPSGSKERLTEAIERLVQHHEAQGKPERAAEWRAKLPPDAADLPAEVFARP
jgi:tetratricopeptide (TPR) repeat protein